MVSQSDKWLVSSCLAVRALSVQLNRECFSLLLVLGSRVSFQLIELETKNHRLEEQNLAWSDK